MVNKSVSIYDEADRLFPRLLKTAEDLEKMSFVDYKERFAETYGEPETFEDALFIVFSYKREIIIDRQFRYGPNNILRRKYQGILTRLDDKLARVEVNLNDTNTPRNMKDFCDALLDGANYLDIALFLAAGIWGKRMRLKKDPR